MRILVGPIQDWREEVMPASPTADQCLCYMRHQVMLYVDLVGFVGFSV
jgi:hypothetical protein